MQNYQLKKWGSACLCACLLVGSLASQSVNASDQPRIITKPKTSATSKTTSASKTDEGMNKLTINFADINGNPVEVKIFPQTLTTPAGSFDLTTATGLKSKEVAKYFTNYETSKSNMVFSMNKNCKVIIYFCLADDSQFDLTNVLKSGFMRKSDHYLQLEFNTDGTAPTDAVFTEVMDSEKVGILNPKLTLTSEKVIKAKKVK